MSPGPKITDLREIHELDQLNALATREGFRMVQLLIEDWHARRNRFDKPGEHLLIAREQHEVIAVGGLNVDPHASTVDTARVRRLYVQPDVRRRGIARQIVHRLTESARGRFTVVNVRTHNPDAARFYERMGFEQDPGAAHHTHTLSLIRTDHAP